MIQNITIRVPGLTVVGVEKSVITRAQIQIVSA